jgi:hypothetical protein
MKTSELLKLDYRDLLKGLVVAVISAVLTAAKTSWDAGSLTFNWDAIETVAASAAASYLIKNLLTDSKVVVKADSPAAGLVLNTADPATPQEKSPAENA